MTRHDHYASLPVSPSRQDGHVWTVESAIRAGQLFVAEEEQYPTTTHLHAREGLPNLLTIHKLFGSMRGYLRALDAPGVAPSPYARRVPCLRCERPFVSPDVRMQRCCARKGCREQWQAREGDGLWMNNTHVTWSTDLGGMFALEENGS